MTENRHSLLRGLSSRYSATDESADVFEQPQNSLNNDLTSENNDFKSSISAPSATPPGLLFPPLYYEDSPEYFVADDSWMTHTSWQWMYCLTDGSYYHVDSSAFFYYDVDSGLFHAIAASDQAADYDANTNVTQNFADTEGQNPPYDDGAKLSKQSENIYDSLEDSTHPHQDYSDSKELTYAEDFTNASLPTGVTEAAEEGFFFLDFDKDILAATGSIMTDFKGKSEREDRHITKQLLPLDLVADTDACCLYTAIFDGHGGSICAQYCVQHLANNLVTTYRQAKETINKKLKKLELSLGRPATTHDLKLAYSSEVEALRRALQKAFEITDQNYLNLAERKGYTDGCTALVVLIYGPDDDGTLKIVTGHAGDCRAVLCRESNALRLTEDHKPERKEERRRIEAAGGRVVYMKEVWRVTTAVGKKLFGLSTARSIGDMYMKRPKELVTAIPDLRIVTVDFNRDQFLILASDGIWDVISDQNACDLVSKYIQETGSPAKAADAIARIAKQRGSSDDKTVTILLFSWFSSVNTSKKSEFIVSFYVRICKNVHVFQFDS